MLHTSGSFIIPSPSSANPFLPWKLPSAVRHNRGQKSAWSRGWCHCAREKQRAEDGTYRVNWNQFLLWQMLVELCTSRLHHWSWTKTPPPPRWKNTEICIHPFSKRRISIRSRSLLILSGAQVKAYKIYIRNKASTLPSAWNHLGSLDNSARQFQLPCLI